MDLRRLLPLRWLGSSEAVDTLTTLAEATNDAAQLDQAIATIRQVLDPAPSFVMLSDRARQLGNTLLADHLLGHAVVTGKPLDLLPTVAAVVPEAVRAIVTELAEELVVKQPRMLYGT